MTKRNGPWDNFPYMYFPWLNRINPGYQKHAWKLMPEIGPSRMSHSHQSSCLNFLHVQFAFSAQGAEIGHNFPF